MELEYPNRIYPISDIKRRFWTPRLLEVPPPPLLEYTKGSHVCSHFLGEGGTFAAFVSRRFPRKPGKCVCFVKSNGYQLSRSRGYIFNKIRGFRWWGMSKVPPDSTEVGGPGEKWQKLRQQLWIFWQARLSIDRVFSLIAVFWCDFAIFDFRLCHCLMNVFSHAWISRSSLAIILIEEEFLFHMVYYTYHLLI